MKRFETVDDLRGQLAIWHQEGERIALVPTMGNLHKGHISLLELAREHAERVVVSVFVNPTQFGPHEDFAEYPRTLDKDALKLSHAGADALFAPSAEVVYPTGIEQATLITVPGASADLEGAIRPGHFEGVASVVCRLFNICQPNVAVFGQKDYQQFIVIKKMARDLHQAVNVIAGPTQRDDNGLALSSRNGYLSDEQRETAAVISQALSRVATLLENGNSDFAALEQQAADEIAAAGLSPDYVSVRDAEGLELPRESSMHLIVLAAARIGEVRLLDNVLVEVPV